MRRYHREIVGIEGDQFELVGHHHPKNLTPILPQNRFLTPDHVRDMLQDTRVNR
jgi:hypothetical protein